MENRGFLVFSFKSFTKSTSLSISSQTAADTEVTLVDHHAHVQTTTMVWSMRYAYPIIFISILAAIICVYIRVWNEHAYGISRSRSCYIAQIKIFKMAGVLKRCILLVVFCLLCFISIQARGILLSIIIGIIRLSWSMYLFFFLLTNVTFVNFINLFLHMFCICSTNA